MKTFRFFRQQKGASMIEYALLLAAIVAVAAVFFGGGDDSVDGAIKNKLTDVVSEIKGE